MYYTIYMTVLCIYNNVLYHIYMTVLCIYNNVLYHMYDCTVYI